MKALCLILAAPILFIATSCSKKEENKPDDSIPPNSISLLVNGVPYPVNMSHTSAVVKQQDSVLTITIGTANLSGKSMYIRMEEFQKKIGDIDFRPDSKSAFVSRPETNDPSNTYSTYNCPQPIRQFKIIRFDEQDHIISGTFSGTICGPLGNEQLITDGKFNISYWPQ